MAVRQLRVPSACSVQEREAAVLKASLANDDERARLTATAATLGVREAALTHQEVRCWGLEPVLGVRHRFWSFAHVSVVDVLVEHSA